MKIWSEELSGVYVVAFEGVTLHDWAAAAAAPAIRATEALDRDMDDSMMRSSENEILESCAGCL